MRLRHCLLALTITGLLAACGRAQQTVNVKLVFQGLEKSEFETVASKVADAVASVAGVPSEYVSMVSISVGGGSSSSSSSAKDTSSRNANNTVSASLLIDGALTTDEVDVRESAPSQLPSALATAPGYIRAQYTEQTYAAAAAAAAAAAGGGRTRTTPGASISSAVPKTTTSPTTSSAGTASANIAAVQHQHNTANTAGSSYKNHSVSAPQVSTPTVPRRVSISALNRKLLAVESTTVVYAIKANASAGPWADADVIRRKILSSAAGFGQASSAGFGKGFYATLDKSGVPYQPTLYLDGVKILAGGLSSEAPRSKFGQRHENDPKVFDPTDLANANRSAVIELRDVRSVALPTQPAAGQHTGLAPWVIGVILAVIVLALALGGVLVWKRCYCRRWRKSDVATQGSSQKQFIAGTSEGSQV